ncbi:MAG: ribonuclease H-like domain-containing protein [Kiritimatiellaeota bacterium]|nr:ribonuclease H-like domain-containing protein [Kiritimatiellota bacterium]
MNRTRYTEIAFLHLPGIGPVRAACLRRTGLGWRELVRIPTPPIPEIPAGTWSGVRRRLAHDIAALDRGDVRALSRALHTEERWRLLADFCDSLTFFDIETTGLSWDGEVTVAGCRHRGELRTFVRGRDLDEFLDVLAGDVTLLVSFNGSSFDVPWVERLFHLPELPCAHVDLRWICHHAGLSGGLKTIERVLGVQRPPDLVGVDGSEAVWLWQRWISVGDAAALERLIRYCAADVLGLVAVTGAVLERLGVRGRRRSYGALLSELEALDMSAPLPRTGTGDRTPARTLLRSRLQRRPWSR